MAQTPYPDLDSLLRARDRRLASGLLAVIQAEDGVEVDSTLRHHLDAGFASLVLLAPQGLTLAKDLTDRVVWVRHHPFYDPPLHTAVTRIARAVPRGTWLYWGYNAEYLIHPFAEARSVAEMLTFHAEERRLSMVAVLVDLYAEDLRRHPTGVDLADPLFDSRGYYARRAAEAARAEGPSDVVIDIYGGLHWRFERFVPPPRRRIDRVALIRCHGRLTLGDDGRTGVAETDSLQCPWHRNLTACVASFRMAKALRGNPEPRRAIESFAWSGSRRFDWTSRQLMDHGLMEPGQWF